MSDDFQRHAFSCNSIFKRFQNSKGKSFLTSLQSHDLGNSAKDLVLTLSDIDRVWKRTLDAEYLSEHKEDMNLTNCSWEDYFGCLKKSFLSKSPQITPQYSKNLRIFELRIVYDWAGRKFDGIIKLALVQDSEERKRSLEKLVVGVLNSLENARHSDGLLCRADEAKESDLENQLREAKNFPRLPDILRNVRLIGASLIPGENEENDAEIVRKYTRFSAHV
eukprot:366271_1